MSEYLQPDHPSSGCDQAWFLYAVKNHRGPGFSRLLLVEARNHAAVAFLERVADDGRVSETVSVMTVHRQCPVIGIRSDLVEEVEFSVFASDIVDRSRVDRDPLAVRAYGEAVSTAPVTVGAPPSPGENHREILSVLKNLGFGDRAPAVLSHIGDLESLPMEDGLRKAMDMCLAESGKDAGK